MKPSYNHIYNDIKNPYRYSSSPTNTRTKKKYLIGDLEC